MIGLKPLFSIYKEPNTTINNDESILTKANNTSVPLITFNPWNHVQLLIAVMDSKYTDFNINIKLKDEKPLLN